MDCFCQELFDISAAVPPLGSTMRSPEVRLLCFALFQTAPDDAVTQNSATGSVVRITKLECSHHFLNYNVASCSFIPEHVDVMHDITRSSRARWCLEH